MTSQSHPFAFALALLGAGMSFLASLSQSIGEAAVHARPLFGALDGPTPGPNSTLVSWAGTAVAVGAMLAPSLWRFYKDGRAAKLESDTAEVDTWNGKLSGEATRRGVAEGRLTVALEQIEELKKQNTEMAAKLAEIRRGIKTVGGLVIENREKAKEQDARIETLERSTGSSDGIPATP